LINQAGLYHGFHALSREISKKSKIISMVAVMRAQHGVELDHLAEFPLAHGFVLGDIAQEFALLLPHQPVVFVAVVHTHSSFYALLIVCTNYLKNAAAAAAFEGSYGCGPLFCSSMRVPFFAGWH